MVRSLAKNGFVWSLTLIVATSPLAAQATTVTLQGTITGIDGSVPEAAQVEVRSRETNVSRGALIDRAGSYRVLGLPPGTYEVAVRAIGYRQQRREDVRLVVGQRATLNFVLERGAADLEPVVITGERAFEVQRTDVSTPVLQEEIEKLPLNSRNVLDLAAIAPGVRTYAAEAGRSIALGRTERSRIFADPGDLAHVVDNLIENALRYSPTGARITVETTSPDSRHALMVADDGPGIPAEERSRIFERFYRGSNGRRSGPGTGLGLAIVAELVERWGGEVRLLDGPGTRVAALFDGAAER